MSDALAKAHQAIGAMCNSSMPRHRSDERCQFCETAHAALERAVQEVHEALSVCQINLDEGNECSADLFELVCSVLENKPNAQEKREQLQAHFDHVHRCQKGSCETELMRVRQKERIAALEAALSDGAASLHIACGLLNAVTNRSIPTEDDEGRVAILKRAIGAVEAFVEKARALLAQKEGE